MLFVDPDVSTLRLKTLRRLLGRDRTLLVFDATTSIREVRAALALTGDVAAIVADGGVLSGTVSMDDVATAEDSDAAIGDVMDRTAPLAPAELEVDDAFALVKEARADRVVVVAPSGELLGILTRAELEAAL
jgi:predicted transcriptional regulator